MDFDSEDLVLDVTVADDLGSWSWKDEDEFDYAIESGRIGTENASQIRSQGERATRLIEEKAFPFVDGLWQRWDPDPTWPLATIPRGWDS